VTLPRTYSEAALDAPGDPAHVARLRASLRRAIEAKQATVPGESARGREEDKCRRLLAEIRLALQGTKQAELPIGGRR
jgi:hypothetical protein